MKLTLAIILLTIISIIQAINGYQGGEVGRGENHGSGIQKGGIQNGGIQNGGVHSTGVRNNERHRSSTQNGGTRNGAIQNNGERSGTRQSSTTTGRRTGTGSVNGFKTGPNGGFPRNVATHDGVPHKIGAGPRQKFGLGPRQIDTAHGGQKFGGKVIGEPKLHHHDHDHFRPGYRRHPVTGIVEKMDSGIGVKEIYRGRPVVVTRPIIEEEPIIINERPIINQKPIIKPVTFINVGGKNKDEILNDESDASCLLDNATCTINGDSNCCSSFCVLIEGKVEGSCQDKADAAAIASQKNIE